MNPTARRIIRWISYVVIGAGLLSAAVAVMTVLVAVFGPEGQRSTMFGLAVGGFGSALANTLIGYGLLALSRLGPGSPHG